MQAEAPRLELGGAPTPELAKSLMERPMIAAYKMERTEGVGSSARRFLSPANADGTMSCPAGELALETAEETPNASAMPRKVVADPNSSMAGERARGIAAAGGVLATAATGRECATAAADVRPAAGVQHERSNTEVRTTRVAIKRFAVSPRSVGDRHTIALLLHARRTGSC
jgi:hypothetical protein